jgi:hypothetical protein
MGINPLHFNGAYNPDLSPVHNVCDSVWQQYAYQHADQVSREDLASMIDHCERQIKEYLGYSLAPQYEYGEEHQYPKPGLFEDLNTGYNVRGFYKGIKTLYGKIISAGRRGMSLVANKVLAAANYSDPDGDGFNELCTITTATILTDINEIHLFFPGRNGFPEYEIRPLISKNIVAGTLTIKLSSWLLIDPDIYTSSPLVDEMGAIILTDESNYVTSVDIYREYIDPTLASAEFLWEYMPVGDYCADDVNVCSPTEQDGCLIIRDSNIGLVAPAPATYVAPSWNNTSFTISTRAPDKVRLYYYAGLQNTRYKMSLMLDPLPDNLAIAIAHMATARLERTICAGSQSNTLAESLRQDMTRSGSQESFTLSQSDLASEFGYRRGELEAWRMIQSLKDRIFDGHSV